MKNLLLLLFVALTLNACNRCKDDDCLNGGECVKRECECPSGYEGERCEIEDLCITSDITCQNGGTCADGRCQCEDGFSGNRCQDEDLCISQNIKCENGGECDDGECDCPDGFTGDFCEEEDLCHDVYCSFGYPCVNGNCDCDQFATGTLCDNKVIDQYLGTHNGEWECNANIENGHVKFIANNSSATRLDIEAEIGFSIYEYYAEFTSPTEFDIPKQIAGSDSIMGGGEFNNGVLTTWFDYTEFGGGCGFQSN